MPVACRQGAGQRPRRIDPYCADQGPSGVHRLQFHQLALTGCGDHDGTHLSDLGNTRDERPQPVADVVGKRIGAAVDLQIATEDAAAVILHPRIDSGAQAADGGDDRDPKGQAQHHAAQAANAAAQFPASQAEGQRETPQSRHGRA